MKLSILIKVINVILLKLLIIIQYSSSSYAKSDSNYFISLCCSHKSITWFRDQSLFHLFKIQKIYKNSWIYFQDWKNKCLQFIL